MTTKSQSYPNTAPATEDFEGAIISSSNIRPDEVILRNSGSKLTINIAFSSGKKIELPLYMYDSDKHMGTLVIPEKFYTEAGKEPELQQLLSSLFANRRRLDVKVDQNNNKILVEPVDTKNHNFTILFTR